MTAAVSSFGRKFQRQDFVHIRNTSSVEDTPTDMDPKNFGVLFYIVPVDVRYDSLADVPDYMAQAIPFVVLLIILEASLGKWRKQELYSVKDTIMSFCLSMFQNVLGFWVQMFSAIPYLLVYKHTTALRERVFPGWEAMMSNQQAPVLTFVLGFVGIELGYYFMHRYAHEFHLLWAPHSLHHSGERYNMATALRQGGTQQMFSMVFYLPLAMLGLPPVHYVRHNRLNTLYQFWIHTELIGRLPWWFELIMNTASHHRLHHRPPGNCNYGGTLIIFDRLFDSFQSECHLISSQAKKSDDPPAVDNVTYPSDYPRGIIYGLAKPLGTYDPVYANVSHMHRLGQSNDTDKSFSFSRMSEKIVRKRVHQPLRLVTSIEEFMPDVLYDWHYLSHYPLWQRPFVVLRRMFRGPPDTTTLVTEESSFNSLTEKMDSTQSWTERDRIFLQGRAKREGVTLSAGKYILVFVHFIFSLLLSLLIMVGGKHLMAAYGVVVTALLSIVAIFSLQLIKFHYE